MKLVHGKYNISVNFEENKANCLIVEDPTVFTELVRELYEQSNGTDGAFILSHKNEELKIQRVMDLILEPITLSLNNKKNIAHLYTELAEYCNEVKYAEMSGIMSEIVGLMDFISIGSAYDLNYDLTLAPEALFKMLGVSFVEETDNLKEKIIQYISIVSSLRTTKLITFVNLKTYLSEAEVEEVYQFSFYRKMPLLLVENIDFGRMDVENACVLDKDLCIIDMS